MNTYDFVHLVLFASENEIRGKTKLQKRVYFAGILTDHVDELGYRPHFYGPYSAEVAGAVDRLRAIGFVEHHIASGNAYDQRGFEVARHDFSLNEAGQKAARTKTKKYAVEWEAINDAIKKLNRTGQVDYMKLSIAAKAYFMLGQKKEGASVSELIKLAKNFGWSVSEEDIEQSASFLQSLQLVKVAD